MGSTITMSSPTSLARPGPIYMHTPELSTLEPNWTHEEVSNLVALWWDAEVQRQFAWAGHSTAHVYETLSGGMHESVKSLRTIGLC